MDLSIFTMNKLQIVKLDIGILQQVVNIINLSLCIPFVTFEVFKFNSKHVIFIICQHVYIFIAQPKFFSRISKSIFIVSPISIKILPWISEIIPPLNNL